MVYFTSDTHYHHENIIRYSGRPFKDVLEMNIEMAARWNERVLPQDTVYHLGDFAMGKAELLDPTRAALRGRIVLILGNHDRSRRRMLQAGFDEVHEKLTLKHGDHTLFMRHHPPAVALGSAIPYCDYYLCGHVHEAWARRGKVINVGVDVSHFRPLTLRELLDRDAPA